MINKMLKSSLFRSVGTYTFSTIINLAIPFFMLPIMTRFLTPVDYGIVSIFTVLIGFVTPFVGMSVYGVIGVKYYDKSIDLPKYITNCFLILITSSGLVGLILLVFSRFISKATSFPREWLWTILLMAITQFIINIVLILWQVQVKPLAYGVYRNLQTVINFGLSIWFVVTLNMGWRGRIGAQVLTVCLFSLIGLIIIYKRGWLKFSIHKQYIKDALYFGVPLIPHTLGSIIITMSDRLFITNMVGIAEAGLYTAGYQIGMIIGAFADGFNQAWVPWFYERLSLNNHEINIKIVKFTYLYNFAILISAFVLTLTAPWFINFFLGKLFQGSLVYIFWVALGYAFNGMYKMVCNYLFYVQKTYILAWITFFAALINIGLNYILIRLNGAVGVAQASSITFFIIFIFTWILSARVYKMPWSLKNLTNYQIQE